MLFDVKKLEDKWKHRIQHILEDKTYRLAYGIDLKGRINLAKAVRYTSNTQAYKVSTRKTLYDGEQCKYEIIFSGPQIAFLEFGTGVYNEPFLMGVSTSYVPSLVNYGRLPDRAGYGMGKGAQYHWAFYKDTNVSLENGDYELTYKTYITKSGETRRYELKKPVIITAGLKPQRMIYNAIKDTIREARKIK